MEATINLKKMSSPRKGVYAGCNRWGGSLAIDKNLTLYFEVINRHDTFYVTVGSDKKFKSGHYYDCETIFYNLDEAKTAIQNFAEKVISNPSFYYSEE